MAYTSEQQKNDEVLATTQEQLCFFLFPGFVCSFYKFKQEYQVWSTVERKLPSYTMFTTFIISY